MDFFQINYQQNIKNAYKSDFGSEDIPLHSLIKISLAIILKV